MSLDIVSYLMGKAAGGGGGGGGQVIPALPSEYQEVEYLESAGNAWSVLRWANDSSPFLETEVALATDAPDTEQAFIGRSGSFEIYYKSGKIQFYGLATGTTINDVVNGQKYKVTSKLKSTFPAGGYEDFLIGAYSPGQYVFTGKIYSVVNYYELGDEKIVCNKYVPCYRKSDNVAGWYSLFGETFYAHNALNNSAPWTAGPDVN